MGANILKLQSDIKLGEKNVELKQTELSNQLVNLGIVLSKSSVESGFQPLIDLNGVIWSSNYSSYLAKDNNWTATPSGKGFVKFGTTIEGGGEENIYYDHSDGTWKSAVTLADRKPGDALDVGSLSNFFNIDGSALHGNVISESVVAAVIVSPTW